MAKGRQYASKKAVERIPHEWRKRVVETLPEEKLLTEGKIVHGRSRDFSWKNPYLRHLLSDAFGEEHGTKATLYEVEGEGDVVEGVRMCYENGIPVVMRGEGTGYTGGAYNMESGLVMDTTKMNRVLDLDAAKGTVKVEAGMRISDLREVVQSVGWDMRQYPTTALMHDATVAGFLSSTAWGLGSARYGSLLDFGNVHALNIVPLIQQTHPISLDAIQDRENMAGILRSLGTSAIITDVTLPLAPAHYWVDVAVTFHSPQQAFAFAMQMHADPTLKMRHLSLLPSSLLTATLNQGERKTHIHFSRNKIPPRDHVSGEYVPQEEANIHPGPEQQEFALPSHPIPETEALVLLSVNEASIPFLNHYAKLRGGHTVYHEHSRGGYGWIEASSWQQASARLSRYYSHTPFSHYEVDLGSFSPFDILAESSSYQNRFFEASRSSTASRHMSSSQQHPFDQDSSSPFGSISSSSSPVLLSSLNHRLQLISQAINQSIRTSPPHSRDSNRNGEVSTSKDEEEWVDESHLLTGDIKCRPAWLLEFVKRPDGRTGIIGQVNFRTQASNFGQLKSRLESIRHSLLLLRSNQTISGFMDPHAYTPDEIYMDSLQEPHWAEWRRAAKSKFDPKSLLNPRQLPSSMKQTNGETS